MIRLKKFVAIVLAIWFPLFSGNAMAASVAMQPLGGKCETGKVTNAVHHTSSHHDTSAHHASLAKPDPSSDQKQSPDPQKTSCKNCGVCHLACTGYMTTAAIKVPADPLLAQSFAPSSSHFQSITTAPLDPPPLVRV